MKRVLKRVQKAVKPAFVLGLALSWLLSGWPRIGNFPPEIKEAQAVVPTFFAAGATADGAAAITPALPASIATNDILLLFLETANQAITIPTPNGGIWTEVLGSPQGTGTAGGLTATRITVFWSRYNGTQGNPTTSDSGNHQGGVIHAYRGVVTTGDPWDVTSGEVEATSNASLSVMGATTNEFDTLVVITAALMDDAQNFGATWTNADLATITVRSNVSGIAGNDWRIGVVTGTKATVGAYRATTNTLTADSVKGMMTIALRPPPPTFEQSAYRWFNNANSTDVGSALTASQDQVATLSSSGQAFRLRILLHIGAVDFALNGRKFKLQFATKSGTCGTYADVAALFWDLSTATYDSVSKAVGTEDTFIHGVAFKSDGTKMYTIGNTIDKVFQYSLATAWDLSTATYDSVFKAVGTEDTAPTGVAFKDDGTKMYIMGNTNDTVYQYSLSTAWDLSTATYDSVSKNIRTEENYPTDVAFKSDGTKMYTTGNTSDKVFQYSLSSPTAIAYNNNATPADGAVLTANANDPTHGHTTVNQDYEEFNYFTNSEAAVLAGQDGKWDFSLFDNGAPASTTYCFRIVKSDSTVLDTYTVTPEITTASAGGLTISGTLRQTNETSAYLCATTGNITMALRVAGAGTNSATCTADTGAYSFTGITAAAGAVITVWANSGGVNFAGSVVTVSNNANITDLDLYANRVIVRHENAGPITNANLGVCDNDSPAACTDTDIGFTANGAPEALVVSDGRELHIWTTDTFTPGGTVTTSVSIDGTDSVVDGDLHIDGTGVLTMGANALSVGGDYNNVGTFNKTAPQTTTFTATATGFTITDGGENFDDLTFNGVGGGWTFADASIIEGILTITNGAVTAPAAAELTIAENFTNNGTFTHNSGTVVMNTTATSQISGTGTPVITFNNFTAATATKIIQFESAETFRFDGLITLSNVTVDAITNTSQWLINHQGTESLATVTLQDSGCAATSTTLSLEDGTSTDSGNNGTCWLFPPELSFSVGTTSIDIGVLEPGGAPVSNTTTLAITSNAYFGYLIKAFRSSTFAFDSFTIADIGCAYGAPCTWPGDGFGYGVNFEYGENTPTDDCDVNGGLFWTAADCAGTQKFAAFATTGAGDTIANFTKPMKGNNHNAIQIKYQAEAGPAQAAGTYSVTIRYVAIPQY